MTRRPLVSHLLTAAVLLFASFAIPAQSPRAKVRALQPEIDAAIDKGVEHLLKHQLPDGSWSQQQVQYPNGMTALAVYTLVKAGLGPEHPAVARGLRFLKRRQPRKTYSCALQMMAFEATHDAEYTKDLRRLLRLLLSWQNGDGGWGYGGENPSRSDLSNTQYAALGLRAAMLAGVKIPLKPLRELYKNGADHQESQRRVKLPPDAVDDDGEYARESRGRPGYAAGFGYTRNGKPTGSMTCAGLAILLICRDCYGDRLPKGLQATIRRSVEVGLNWMRKHWDVARNPTADGKGAGWHLYYLYGLERVGSLMLSEVMAGRAWYFEGAKYLVEKQRPNGSWGNESDTTFAILFLKKATWAGRTTGSGAGKEPVFANATGPVHVRAAGNPKMTVWIDGFGDGIRKKFGIDGKESGLHVLRVEYLVDSKVVATVEGDPALPWQNESYAARYEFPLNGNRQVFARMHVLPPGAEAHTADTKVQVLESKPFMVNVTLAFDPVVDALQKAVEGNVIRARAVRARASADGRKPLAFLYDGLEGTAWIADPKDPAPTVTLRLGTGVRCRFLMISPGRGVNGCGPLTKLEVRINREREARIVAVKGVEPVTIDLGKERKVGLIQLRLHGREGAKRPPGISEIYAY